MLTQENSSNNIKFSGELMSVADNNLAFSEKLSHMLILGVSCVIPRDKRTLCLEVTMIAMKFHEDSSVGGIHRLFHLINHCAP
jgi:hypothetical protein